MKEPGSQGINLTGFLILPVDIWLRDHRFMPWISQEAQKPFLTLWLWLPISWGTLVDVAP